MAPVYVVQPEDDSFLTSLSTEPILRTLKVKQIEIDNVSKSWTIHFASGKQGSDQFWDKLGTQLTASIPEVARIDFKWEDPQNEKTADVSYMESLVKQFTASPPIVQTCDSAPSEKPVGRRNGRKRALLQESIPGSPVQIKDILEEERNLILQGEVTALDQRATKTGKTLVMFDIFDGSDSLTCKVFLEENSALEVNKGDFVKVKGNVQYQSFDGELSMMVQQICPISPPAEVTDDALEKRIELHLHTKMSGMDGIINVGDAIKQAAKWKHPAVAITDHGVIQAFPEAYFAGEKYGVKIIYGLEGYLVDGEKDRPFHIILLAKDEVGLKNLYRLISISHMDHFYRKPRIPRELLRRHREGIIVGSACEAGEVYQAVLRQNPDVIRIASFYDYLEIQPLGNNEFLIGTEFVHSQQDLMDINKKICDLGVELKKPVVATGDVHFLRPNDSLYRTVLLAGQGFEDAEHQAPLHFRTTKEMLAEFTYLGDELASEVVVTNPVLIASQVKPLIPVPQGLHPPKIDNAEQILREMTSETAKKLYGDTLPEIVQQRLEKELKSIIDNGYASLYWIAHKLVKKSLDDGYLVGSRGSVGSSLVATMCQITEVNPLPPHYVCPKCKFCEFFTDGEVGSGVDLADKSCPHCQGKLRKEGFDIPFEVFMGFHGDKVPDIDLNFSGEYQSNVHKYTEELFGSDHVFRAGTIGTLAEKTAYGFIKKYLDQTGQTRRNAEINRLVSKITGVRRTTGQHPGGMMVVPSDFEVFDFTPVQYPANDGTSGTVTTHFDYHAIHDSLVKLDILGHDDPTMLRILEDITTIPVTDIPLDDQATMSIFSSLEALELTEDQIGSSVGTLGIPEFGTRFVRQMLVETKPKSFSDLVRISGLSHGTNVWANNAQTLIKDNVTDLGNVIACRDDIMVYLIHKGLEPGTAFRIMEKVRKGKGLDEDDVKAMKDHKIPGWYIESCNRISYLFPKAHAVAYVTMAFRIAYFKVHYPEAYYGSYFSVRASEFDADLVIHGPDRIVQEMREIEGKGNTATAKERNVYTILEIVLEAMARGIDFVPVDLYKSDHRMFVLENGKLIPPLVALQGLGANAALSIVQARQEGEFRSIEDLRQRAKVTKSVIEVMRNHGSLDGMSETNQLTLF